MPIENPQIGCIILTDPFFFDEADWIPVPENWSNNIVRGKVYSDDEYGRRLLEQIQERIYSKYSDRCIQNGSDVSTGHHQLGQGAFRIVVTEAYQRHCAISGEIALPVLEATHIMPHSENGPHLVRNGLLLRSDFHTLFVDGYITVAPDFHIEISHRLQDDFGNECDYYKYQGSRLLVLPQQYSDRPASEYLEWHNNNVFLG